MKTNLQNISKFWFSGLCAAILGSLTASAAHGQIFVGTGTGIGEYNLDGSTVNASLVSGLTYPFFAVSGSDLYVASPGGSTIGAYDTLGNTVNPSLVSGMSSLGGFSVAMSNDMGFNGGIAVSGSDLFIVNGSKTSEYTTSGDTVNLSLISGVILPCGIAVSGSYLFVTNAFGTVGEYNLDGTPVNPTLITGLGFDLHGIAVSGSDLFVTSCQGKTVGEYDTSGNAVNSSLISGADYVTGIAALGSDLYIAFDSTINGGYVAEYTTSGDVVNPALVTGVSDIGTVAVEDVPEPSTWAMLIGGIGILVLHRRRR